MIFSIEWKIYFRFIPRLFVLRLWFIWRSEGFCTEYSFHFHAPGCKSIHGRLWFHFYYVRLARRQFVLFIDIGDVSAITCMVDEQFSSELNWYSCAIEIKAYIQSGDWKKRATRREREKPKPKVSELGAILGKKIKNCLLKNPLTLKIPGTGSGRDCWRRGRGYGCLLPSSY